MKDKIFNALFWTLSIIVIFLGVMLSLSGFYGVFILLAGLVLNPAVSSALHLRRWLSVVGFLVLFLAAIMATPRTDDDMNQAIEPDASTVLQVEEPEVALEPDPFAEEIEKASGDEGEDPDSQVLHLNAGDWIVGVDIEAGRYNITTEDSSCVLRVKSSGEDASRISAFLEEGDGGYTGMLEDGDQLHCSEPIDLTPYRP